MKKEKLLSIHNGVLEVQEVLKKIVSDVHEELDKQDETLSFSFPNDYIDYDIAFDVWDGVLVGTFTYVDPYDDIMDEEVQIRIPFDVLENKSWVNYFLTQNEKTQEHSENSELRSYAMGIKNLLMCDNIQDETISHLKTLKDSLNAMEVLK